MSKRAIEAGLRNNNHEVKENGYLSFGRQTNKIIDAEQYQDGFLTLMLRDRAAARRHQSPIIEVW